MVAETLHSRPVAFNTSERRPWITCWVSWGDAAGNFVPLDALKARDQVYQKKDLYEKNLDLYRDGCAYDFYIYFYSAYSKGDAKNLSKHPIQRCATSQSQSPRVNSLLLGPLKCLRLFSPS